MDKLRALYMAITMGLKDGYESPDCLSVGMTWGDRNLWANDVYDKSVSIGQRIGAMR